MKRTRRLIPGLLPLLVFVLGAVRTDGAGRVELVLATQPRVPITGQQEWLRKLSQAGIADIRIRAALPSDRPGIEIRGTETSPIYVVTGLINSDNLVVVPGGRYRSADAPRLAHWLDELAEQGPPQSRPRRAAFGLTADQFQALHDELARPVAFSTLGMTRVEVVRKIAAGLKTPLRGDAAGQRALEQDAVGDQLRGVSLGTALADVLRPAGLCLVPGEAAGGGVRLAIAASRPELEIWPVGWKPQKPLRQLLPEIYDFRDVNVRGVAVSKVLSAVSGRLELPVLLDHNALARHGIDPEKAIVSLPASRTTYSLLLRRALGQARLKSEIRVDEAGKPLLWVTTIKPL